MALTNRYKLHHGDSGAEDDISKALSWLQSSPAGSLVGWAWSLLRNQAKVLIPVFLVLLVIDLLIAFPSAAMQFLPRNESFNPGLVLVMVLALSGLMIVCMLLGYYLILLLSVGLVRYLYGRLVPHHAIDLWSGMKFALSHWLPLLLHYLWMMVVGVASGFTGFFFYIALYLGASVVGTLFAVSLGPTGAVIYIAAVIVSTLVSIVLVLLVYGFAVTLTFMPVTLFAIGDGTQWVPQMGHCYKLLFSNGWRSMGLGLFLILVTTVIGSAWIGPVYIWFIWEVGRAAQAGPGEMVSPWVMVVMTLWGQLITPVNILLFISAITTFLMDCQIRKTGLDLGFRLEKLRKAHHILSFKEEQDLNNGGEAAPAT